MTSTIGSFLSSISTHFLKRQSLVARLGKSFFFVILAGVAWLLVNSFNVARSEGFDPFRYEYLAREGLAEEFLLVTGYRIVIVLQWLYTFLPQFIGFSIFCAALHASLHMRIREKALWLALFNPITFYYIGQTGKDGISILAFVSTASLALGGRRLSDVAAWLIIVLGLVLRPPIVIFLPSIFFMYRRKPLAALMAALLVGLMYVAISNQEEVAESLIGLVTRSDEADATQSARDFTFGTGILTVLVRFVLYAFSMLFQPIVGVVKFASSSEYFVLYEAMAYGAFLGLMIYKHVLKDFMVAALPFALVIAIVFPFYHFRYLAATYPIVLSWVLMNRKSTLQSPRRLVFRIRMRNFKKSIPSSNRFSPLRIKVKS